MKKIYIAGKISGECETTELLKKCWNKFEDYGISILIKVDSISYSLKDVFYYTNNIKQVNNQVGFTHGFLINSELIKSGKGTLDQYMKNDLTVMLTCDEVHFLPDWKYSNGAKIEHQLCLDLKIKIIYA